MNHFGKAIVWTQLLALALLVLLLYPQEAWYRQIIRGVLASVFILFVPGYWLSYIFFSDQELSSFERFVMSIASSVALITFTSFYLHYFSIALYPIHIYVLSISLVVCSALGVRWIDRKRMEREVA